MPAFRGRGGRGRGGGGHQRHGGGHQRPGGGHQRHHFNRRQDERDSEWFQNVRSNHDAVDIEFADYNGEKKHELPEEFVKMLNADQTEAKDDNYLQESDFGITEYVSKDSPGFSGILKHRYSDFVVHEIDQNGEVVKLTDTSMPSDDTTPDAPGSFAEYEQLDEKHKELISALSWIRLLQLAKKCAEGSAKEGIAEHGDVKIDVSKKSKDDRKLFHNIIKTHFPHLDSKTENVGDDKKFIMVTAKKKLPTNVWPRNRPKHLTFHLCKVK